MFYYFYLFSYSGSATPRGYGGLTPRGPPGGNTPGGSRPAASPAYRGRGSSAGNLWAAAAESWAGGSGRRTPRGDGGGGGGQKGYSTTPRYDDPRLTPKYGGGSRTPQSSGRPMPPPQGRTPHGRTPTQGRTPRGQFGDSTPLYDE